MLMDLDVAFDCKDDWCIKLRQIVFDMDLPRDKEDKCLSAVDLLWDSLCDVELPIFYLEMILEDLA